MSNLDHQNMNLPYDKNLPINKLAACFNNTAATYKYYWLLSIIQEVELGNIDIPKLKLFSRMISNSWFTVNYFHISFGKQDLIQDAVHFINSNEKIAIDAGFDAVLRKLTQTSNKETLNKLWHFNKNVPHWFLSPWYPGCEKKEIYTLSKSLSNHPLYSLSEDSILINPVWVNYLKFNSRLLKDFCFWNLALFLQSKNPNVPDIPNKLFKPAIRSGLTNQRVKFWDIVFDTVKTIKCIYTGKNLIKGEYAVEHFIPYSFVSHDLIWNLIPADKSFNSTKSDKLPPMDKYFVPFFELQKSAIEIIRIKTPSNKLLEDYLTIFPDLNSIKIENFRNRIQPLITIAANNGFEYLSE